MAQCDKHSSPTIKFETWTVRVEKRTNSTKLSYNLHHMHIWTHTLTLVPYKPQEKRPLFLYAYYGSTAIIHIPLSARAKWEFTVLSLKGRASPHQCFTITLSGRRRGWRQVSSHPILLVAKELYKVKRPCLRGVHHKATSFLPSLHNTLRQSQFNFKG